MTGMEISEKFSFRGWSFRAWAQYNKIEILKVATTISGAIMGIVAGYNPILVGLVGLVVKFGLDALHYYFNTQLFVEAEED
jgi:hypothetical protein